MRNSMRVPTSMGTIVILKSNTMAVIGSTLARDSLIFSFSFSFILRKQTSFVR